MQVPHNSLVLVADGKKMLFFRNEGDATYPNLQVEVAQEQEAPATRDQRSDAAGRASSPQGAAQSAIEQTDYHQQDEDRFAALAADMLRERALSGDFESLIIVAPPRTLGEMRKHYHKAVEQRLAGEIAKDLTGHPVDQIERIIVAAD